MVEIQSLNQRITALETDSNFIAFKATTIQTSTLALVSGDTFIFDSKVFDYGDGYSTATGIYTIPVDGIYEFHAFLWATTTQTSDGPISIKMIRGGVESFKLFGGRSIVAGIGVKLSIDTYLAGDQIKIVSESTVSYIRSQDRFHFSGQCLKKL